MTEETNTAAQSPEAKAQAMAHTAIKDVRTALSDLQGKFAGATTDHFAVPRHMLKDLEARIHTAEMWFLHLFPHLRSTQDEGGGAPTSADPVPTVDRKSVV